MESNLVFIIRYYDMGSSSVKGVYSSPEGAKDASYQIVKKINARIAKRNNEFDTQLELDEKCEDDGNVLLRFKNHIRVVEVKQYEVNKATNDSIDRSDYFKD